MKTPVFRFASAAMTRYDKPSQAKSIAHPSMKLISLAKPAVRIFLALACATFSSAQETPPAAPLAPPRFDRPPPFDPGRPPGGFGGMMREELKLVDQFDKDGDKRLSKTERQAARDHLKEQPREGFGRGPRFGDGGTEEAPKPGPALTPADAQAYPDAPLYDPRTLRTFFLEFENENWEKELAEFHNTDVEVPARLTVDGKTYEDVGVHFRGMSSYGMVGEGWKRSLNLSLDFAHPDQNLAGYRTLNLLNSHGDPTFLRTVLYFQIAREYLPAPGANHVRVAINGESWGIYINAQQFNKDFLRDWYGVTSGARWKVPGSPRGRGGLEYLGDDPAEYKRIYEIKSRDKPESWAALIHFCKVLNETPPEKLEKALTPILNTDGVLRYLAVDNALINNDGYWIRSSDYNIYQDNAGRFHILPHDANETFLTPGGPGFGRRGQGFGGPGSPPTLDASGNASGGDVRRPVRRPPGGGAPVDGVKLDPLTGMDDPTKPLISKLLAVPELKARYLGYVRDIAERWLDWKKIGPLAEEYHALIERDVEADTRKLDSTEAFHNGVTGQASAETEPPRRGRRGNRISLKKFVEERREYLLNHPEIKKL
jgi:hypothetical protein